MDWSTEKLLQDLKVLKDKVNNEIVHNEIISNDVFPIDEFLDLETMTELTAWLSAGNENVDDFFEDLNWDDASRTSKLLTALEEIQFEPAVKLQAISTRTFTRPRKSTTRSHLSALITSSDKVALQRRLTTTITATPEIIGHLETLSKTQNRPLSATYMDWEGNETNEGLADYPENQSQISSKQPVSVNVLQRLRQIKEANNPNVTVISSTPPDPKPKFIVGVDGQVTQKGFNPMLRNMPESNWLSNYDSFINIDDSQYSLCRSMTESMTNQSIADSFFNDIRPEQKHNLPQLPAENSMRMTFGGEAIPDKAASSETLNNTFVREDELITVSSETQKNKTFTHEDHTFNVERENRTFSAKSDSNLNVIGNSTFSTATFKALSTTMTSNGYSSKLFDSTFSKPIRRHEGTYTRNSPIDGRESPPIDGKTPPSTNGTYTRNSPVDRVLKRNDDPGSLSEDDRMSTTSDRSSIRSVNSSMDDIRMNAKNAQSKKLASTPKIGVPNRPSADWQYSPIPSDSTESLSSSRNQSPLRHPRESLQPKGFNLSEVKDKVKVPQQGLKLKPALGNLPGTFKRPATANPVNGRSGEPIKPMKPVKAVVDPTVGFDQGNNTQTLNSTAATNRLLNASSIPRPASRLRQPQARYTEGKK